MPDFNSTLKTPSETLIPGLELTELRDTELRDVSAEKVQRADDLAVSNRITVDEPPPGELADGNKYVTGIPLIFIYTGMLMSIFLAALDQTIVATAVPRIASQFDALEQVTWITSAYFLAQAGFMLTYGQVLRVVTTKWVYLFSITLFEVGSLICGASPNVNVLIFGRFLGGCGADGIWVSCLSILATCTRIEQRAVFFALFTGVFVMSSVIGPLLGGVLTDRLSWRWCFYINLPLGAISFIAIIFFIKPEHSVAPRSHPDPLWKRLVRLDWAGTILCLGVVTSLIFPLQWGGVTKPWSDKSVIACFCVFGVLLPIFIASQWWLGDNAMMPLRLFTRRTQIGCSIEAFFGMLILLCATYYLPLYYQSAEQHTATRSGVDILVYMMSTIVSGFISTAFIKMTGRPRPLLILGPPLSALGSGLMFWALTSSPTPAKVYGFQVLLGLGVGGVLQNVFIAIQAEYADQPDMVPQSNALVNVIQLIGGVIGLAIAGTIFNNRLSANITTFAPGLDAATAAAVKQSVQAISTVSGPMHDALIKAYTNALGYVFVLCIPSGILGGVAAMLIRDFNLNAREKPSSATVVAPA